ncbi:LYR motif-containing protein 2 [Nilaparvata lugens]|uniref:LYR motif-containing protein 2 n=1 Tax=Nilaparvata lugens TaxID=108931 RepID=UPI00193DF213|nr:LYR motif-containing protein 2 [Nilaparvata lugens]
MANKALSLKQFMLRQHVLKLYRDTLRAIKKIPDPSDRKDMKDWVRSDYKKNINLTDEFKIKMLIKHGEKSLDDLRKSLELSHAAS